MEILANAVVQKENISSILKAAKLLVGFDKVVGLILEEFRVRYPTSTFDIDGADWVVNVFVYWHFGFTLIALQLDAPSRGVLRDAQDVDRNFQIEVFATLTHAIAEA